MSSFRMPQIENPKITKREAGAFGLGASIASVFASLTGYFLGGRRTVKLMAERVNALEQEKAELEEALAENDIIIEKIAAKNPDLVEQVLTDMDEESALQEALERTKKMMAAMAAASGLSPEEMQQAKELAFGAIGLDADSIASLIQETAGPVAEPEPNVVVVPATAKAAVPASPAPAPVPVSRRRRGTGNNAVAASVTTGLKEAAPVKKEKEPASS